MVAVGYRRDGTEVLSLTGNQEALRFEANNCGLNVQLIREVIRECADLGHVFEDKVSDGPVVECLVCRGLSWR